MRMHSCRFFKVASFHAACFVTAILSEAEGDEIFLSNCEVKFDGDALSLALDCDENVPAAIMAPESDCACETQGDWIIIPALDNAAGLPIEYDAGTLTNKFKFNYRQPSCDPFFQCIFRTGQNHKAEPYIFITFVVVLVILSAFIRWLYKNREHQLRMLATDFQLELQLLRDNGELEEEQMQSCNFTVPREIPRVMVEMHEVIGSGEFGDVMRGFLDEYKVTGIPAFSVAIKTVKDASSDTAIHEFNREAAVSALVSGHPNLVSLIGVVTRGVPLMMVTQYYPPALHEIATSDYH
eukprot:gene18631-385_t